MNLRLLLSSEDPVLIQNLDAQARALGERLLIANSSTTLDQTRTFAPQLLILDLAQRIDGRLLLARLKQDPKTAYLRIAALAPRDDDRVHRFCVEYGAASYSLKPVSFAYLERELSPLRNARLAMPGMAPPH